MSLPADPNELQNTVNDFLDFTEYLSADIARSTSLIALCDENYITASKTAYDVTKQLQELPTLSSRERLNATELRSGAAQAAQEIINARTLSLAEAVRQLENIERHLNRAKTIEIKLLKKREDYPESREASPLPRQSASPQATRPKITLRVDGARSGPDHEGHRLHRRPIRRIVVPGEVLAPHEADFEEYWGSTSSESESDDSLSTARRTPGRGMSSGPGRFNIKLPKIPKIKGPKPPRLPRLPGMVGTNVHSSVAGISTSNALAKLKPPPEDAVIGDEHLPWMRLTQYELAKLRKRMKKNAVWNPSDTMVQRELHDYGRGRAEFEAAKKHAIANGLPLPVVIPRSAAELAEMAAISGAAVDPYLGTVPMEGDVSQDVQITNRGMILNIQKKQKREAQAKQAWEDAVHEAEQSARKVKNVAEVMRGLFARESESGPLGSTSTPSRTLPKGVSPAKRKRVSTPPEAEPVGSGAAKADGDNVEAEASTPAIKPQKRPKTETPIPPPKSSVSINAAALLARSRAQAEQSPAADSTVDPTTPSVTSQTTTTIVPLKGSSPPKKSSTPILPPTRDRRATTASAKNATTTTRATTPGQPVTRAQTSAATTPVPEPVSIRRSSSRGKTTSVEPQSALKDRPRRSSTAHNTPAPEAPARPPSRQTRRKRPAPGPVTSGAEGSTVSVGRRSAATRKKAGPKKQQKDEEKDVPDMWDEIDDEGNVIDPNEPRYCICNRVSFGVMICCENNDCEKEWFHLECIGLNDIPPRTTKWYCPDCRITLRIGEKGEITARGKKK